MGFQAVRPTLLYEKVVDMIKDLIKSGELKPGDRLPAERDLGQKLAVSRSTLREALRVLELDGLIETRPGGGRYVRMAKPDLSTSDDLIASLENAAIWDLLEVREVLEAKIVELACLRAGRSDLDAIASAVAAGRRAVDMGGPVTTVDEDFHLALAQASHNVVFYNVMRLHMMMLQRTRQRTTSMPGRALEMQQEHEDIYEAIKARNVGEAVAAVHKHLNAIRRRLAPTQGNGS